MNLKTIFLLLALLSILTSQSDPSRASEQLPVDSVYNPVKDYYVRFIKDQVIVRRSSCTEPQWSEFLEKYDAAVLSVINGEYYVLSVISSVNDPLLQIIGEMRTENCVLRAVPDLLLYASNYYPVDPGFQNQWYMHDQSTAPSYDLDLPQAWSIQRGNLTSPPGGVVIGIFDSGLPYSPLCSANSQHPDFLPSDRIELLFAVGHEAAECPGNAGYGDGLDVDGHGTLVAGIIGAANNSLNVVGVNHASTLANAQVMWSPGQFLILDWWLSATFLFIDDTYHPGARKIMNCSWGGSLDPNNNEELEIIEFIEYEIIQWTYTGNVLVVAAAGNRANIHGQSEVDFPARFAGWGSDPLFEEGYNNVVCVSGYERNGDFWMYSQSGAEVTVSAPAGSSWGCFSPNFNQIDLWHEPDDIYSSSLPEWTIPDCCQLWHMNDELFCGPNMTPIAAWWGGTSASAAMVSGIASLVWEQGYDYLAAADVRSILEASAYNPDNPGGFEYGFGWGQVNAIKALLRTPGSKQISQSDLSLDRPVDPEQNHYVLVDELFVASPWTLYIEPGITLEFAPGARIVVEDGASIIANGTSLARILFEANDADLEHAWSGIYLQGTDNVFNYCDFTNASVAIRAYSGGGATLTNCTFDNCGIGIAAIHHADVTANSCTITDSRVYGMFAQSATITDIQGSVSASARGGIWALGNSVADLYLTDVYENGSAVDLNQGGIRNTFSMLKLKCVKSQDNNGPGVTCLGGFTQMSPPAEYGRNTITNNRPPDGETQTQIYFNNAQFNLCNGRNMVCADDGWQIMDTWPIEHDVRNNYWCGDHHYPAEYVNSVDDDETTPNRCGLNSFNDCAETEPAQWFQDGWIMENDLQFASAILNYRHVVEYFPESDEAKLCPDRILFCESMQTKDWETWRTYFREIADTTQSDALKFEVLASAAWCQVEKGELDSAYQEFDNLMNQSSSEYEYQKAALASLMAELAEAGWDTIGIERHRGQGTGRGVDSQVQAADPLLDLVDRMEAVLRGSSGSRPVAPLPSRYTLHQNYPNPFNPTTEIRFDLPENSHVELSIFNTLGQKVATLMDEPRTAGTYRAQWDASSVASGIYLYQMKAGTFTKTKKMILMR